MSLLWDAEVEARVNRLELPFNRRGLDPYGISKKDLTRWFSILSWFYKNYFTVTVEGIDNVPPRGRAMLVGNHSGGVALDGAMVLASMLLEMEPPRLAQAMVEKFINLIPFAAQWTSRTGQFTGLPEHAERLLERRAAAHGLSRGRARHRQALLGAPLAGRLRHRLRAAGAGDEDARSCRSPSSAAARRSRR